MMRIYFIAALVAAGVALYFFGRGVGAVRCRADGVVVTLQAQNQIIKQIEKINAETFNTDTVAVRRWLRENYTIAE